MDSGGGGSFLFIAVVVSSPPPAGNAANVSLVRGSSIGCMGCDQIIMLISYFWFRWWNTCQMCVHTQVLRYVQCVYIHTHFNPYIPQGLGVSGREGIPNTGIPSPYSGIPIVTDLYKFQIVGYSRQMETYQTSRQTSRQIWLSGTL